MKKAMKFIPLLFLLICAACVQTTAPADYPLIAGMNISATGYNDPAYQANIAKADLAILGFYKGWNLGGKSVQQAVREIKALNPDILVGQYTILSEMYDYANPSTDEIRAKLYAEGWWLLNASGNKVQWTPAFNTWEVNFTSYTSADADGFRYPQWIARLYYNTFFQPVPEFDVWYFDNVFPKPRVAADYNLDVVDDLPDDAIIKQAYRGGVVAEWTAARALKNSTIFIGNVTDLSSTEYTKKLDGGFLEGAMGKAWSIETTGTWSQMMEGYRSAIANVRNPKMVIFNVWGASGDYALMRYGLASCLLDNGHFSYTDSAVGYGAIPWFDEFDVSLGAPLDAPPTAAWQNGVFRRRYVRGMVLVNPKGNGTATVDVGTGYRRISGTQDPVVNNGADAASVTLNERDGIILLKK